MKRLRNSNIELLRIFSMCIIIAYHLVSNGILKVNGNGTFSLWNSGSEINRIFSCFLFPGGAVGNMIFFMTGA